MRRDEILRTYGILPERKAPPRGRIRSRLTTGNIFGQWIAFLMFGIGPILLGLFLLIVVPVLSIRLGLAGFLCLLGLCLGFFIARDVKEWVELDGDAFRWKHLFTRQVSERDLSEIEAIVTLTLAFQADEFQVLLLLPGVFIASITMGPSAAFALLTSLLFMGRSRRDSYTYIM
jgi:hypothetical protein